MITLKQIREAELEVSKGNPIPSEAAAKGLSLEKLMVYEAAKADMASRVDRVLDRHIESAGGGGEVGDMIEEAAGEFFRLTEMENAMPVRSMELLEITCVDFLGAAGRRFFDCEGRPAKSVDESLPGRRYARELPSGSRSSGRAGSITACGEKLDGFDEGFVDAFAQMLNTGVMGFNRARFDMQQDGMLRYLNDLMGNDALPIEARRQRMIDEVVARTGAAEGFVVLVKDGRKPTVESVTAADLEVKEAAGEADGDKAAYILDKAVQVIKTPQEVNVFSDRRETFGCAMAVELKVNETGKIGGAFVLFGDREFSCEQQLLAEKAGLKVDDYIIFNLELREERKQRERVLHVLIPMVGEKQAAYLLGEHAARKFAEPVQKFAVIFLSDMRGSTDAADKLMLESGRRDPGKAAGDRDRDETLERYRLYVKNINTYLGISTEAVLRFGGVIDKYIGDAVMAAWGVPVVKEDRRSIARRAILAAVYANTLTTFTIKRMKEDGIDPIFIFEQRFVLHCGEVLAGIFGTPLRFGYTTMGAPVNETSRMEGLPEAHTGKVTISGPLNALIEDIAETEFVCSAKLKGKVDTIDVFHFKRFKVDDFPAFAREYMDDRKSDIFPQNDFFEQYVMGEGGHVK